MKELDRRILEAERRLKELTAIKNGQIKDETKPLLAELEDLLNEYDLNDKILFKIKTDTRLYYDVVYYVPVSLEIRSIKNDVVLSKLDVRDLEDEEVLKRIKSYLAEYASRLKLLVELTNRFRFSKFYDGSKKLVIDLGVKNKITVGFSTNNDDVFVSASRVLDNQDNEMSFVVEDDKALIKNFKPSSQFEYGCNDLDVTDIEYDEIKELIVEHVATPSCMSNYTLIAKLKQN